MQPARQTTDIIVTAQATKPQSGVLRFGTFRTRCALGRGGITRNKTEGDGKTPIGRFPLRRIWARPDRVTALESRLDIYEISQKSGWCDDVRAPFYNRPIRRPCRFSHERLWRHDRLYDVIVELGQNDAPPVPGGGSAIFLHLEKANYQPTLGCIAINRAAIAYLITHVRPDTALVVAE